jgi:phosphoglycolate phosphatase
MPRILNKNLPNPPKAIIFDWDGVLVQTTDFIKQAFIHTQQVVSPHLEPQKELPGLSLRDYFPGFFGEKAALAEGIFYDYVEKNHLSVLKETPGASDLLRVLAEQPYPLFIISNKKGELLRKEVDYLSWAGYFSRVIGSGDCLEDKPAVLPVKIVLGSSLLEPSKDIWFVGDSAVDMECAGKSGCSSLFVHPGREQEPLISMDFPVDAVVFSCKDLQNIVINNKL